jgi:poly-gamma-glutamate capsule biosynthesis protein CapA/YwtB (metallophosphatase superfamily)/glutathione synthase/RimK-type ligase-like ATP-grasp enzyme
MIKGMLTMTKVKDYPSAQEITDSSYEQRKVKLADKSADTTLEILFVGDTSFGENYQQRLEDTGRENILKSKGYEYPLAKMKSLLTSVDFVVANLETPITDIQTSPFVDKKAYVHWSDVVKAPAQLLQHNIYAVSLANNHSFDYGNEGFSQTLDILEKAKIHYFGAGRNQQEASEALIIESNIAGHAFSCAIIGAFQESSSYRRDYQAYAEGEKGGVNALHIDTVIKNIRAIKAYNPDTFVIVFPHWGYNYEWKSPAQMREAKALIDNGADFILGHGAHMLQEIEHYNNKWIAYSIGNFMFNSPGRYAQHKAPPYGFVAKLIVRAENDALSLACRLYPVVTDNKQTHYQTTFVTEPQFNDVCEVLTEKNTSSNTFLHSLARNKDDHGHYLELPINSEHTAAPAAASHHIGYICNTRSGITPGMKAKKWMFRGVSMCRALKQHGLELFIYAYHHIDPKTGTVSGHILENDQFVEKTLPVPKVNYDWFLGPKVHVRERPLSSTKFAEWAEKNNRAVFPHSSYMALAKDKLLSYKTIAEFDKELGIYTELYSGKIGQLDRFIQNNSSIFLKPQFGNSGIGIIVIKKVKDRYTLTHYERGKNASLSLDSLSSAYAQANKLISNQPYIIQNGITTERIDASTFDIRLVVIGKQNAWKIITEVRVGAKESDLSNVAQGGSCIELDDLFNKLSGKLNPSEFKKRLMDTIVRLTSFLDAYYPSKVLEMAYDIIIDTQQKFHITEINCKPGSPMIFVDFNNIFDLTQEEHHLYTKYIEPHGQILASAIHERWQEAENEQRSIWFDTAFSPLALEAEDKNTLMREIYQALQQKRPLIKDNLPQRLINDLSPRIVFLSISNGFSRAQVGMATGSGLLSAVERALTKLPTLYKEHYKPIWLKLDIVTEAISHPQNNLNNPLNIERSLCGIAFTQDIDMAFLPEQLTAQTLVTSDSVLHRRNIFRAISSNPYYSDRFQKIKALEHATLYEFKTTSVFYAGESIIPLYRGHRKITTLTQDILLDAVDLAADYLIRSIDMQGRFIYSYRPKTDEVAPTYNILRHAGTLYSMLEAYELRRDATLLSAAQRGLAYLINQMKETVVNNEQTLVVVENNEVKLGGNGLAALAIAKYIQLTQDKSYFSIMQKIGAWIINTQDSEGKFTLHKQIYNGATDPDFESEYYPGEALFALARLYQLDPQERWLKAAVNGALFLINVRDKGVPEAKLNHDHWLLYALNEIYRLQAHPYILAHAKKISNVIINRQRTTSSYSDWVGSYYNPPRSTPTATRMEGLCASYQLSRDYGTPEEANIILTALKLGIQFQLQTQIHPESALYLPNPQQAIGGFHRSLTDFEIRIDYVQHNISSLLGLHKILSQIAG